MRKVKRPNFFIYYFLLLFVGPFFKIKNRVRFNRKEIKKLKGPALVIANHPSRPDFVYSIMALFKRRLNVVVARNYTYYPSLHYLLKITHTIPKNLFNPDSSTVKSIMSIIKKGGSVLMMPEGRLSSNGSIGVMPEGIEKLVQKLGVTVVNIHIDGAYLTGAKWITRRRKGRINVKTSIILTPEETKKLPLETIKQKIITSLYYNDFEWIKENPNISFKGRSLTSGLDNLLYLCPHCGTEFNLISKRHQFICTNCFYEVSLDNRYQFTSKNQYPLYFENIYSWFEYQRQVIEQQLTQNDLYLEVKVKLKMPRNIKNNMQIKVVGEGICTINKEGLFYSGMIEGKLEKIFFPIAIMPTLLFGCDEDFEIYYDNHFYYFEPLINRKQVVKWSLFTEVAYQLYQKKAKQE